LAIKHYIYSVLKTLGPHGAIPIRGDVKRAFDYDRESYEIVDGLMVSIERQELKQALVESTPLAPNPFMPEAKTSKMSIQSEDTLSKMIPMSMEEPIKVANIGNSLDPK
jgi:hypothetical protein